ncbi:MAG TPA: SRPBCC family protein [Fimbriimonadaceae bacterium]|nr:SRPBCC family protein [Fimbriimonadaceae bacterium]
MPRIEVATLILAPPEVCFDLARDIRVHEQTTQGTGERVVSAPESGMLAMGDEVTFEAKHLGVRQRLTSKIVAYDRPREFTDEMQRGAFKSLRHIHRFEAEDGGTRMIDILEFQSPGWIFGAIFDALFLAGYMRRFLVRRGEELRVIAERGSPDGSGRD